MKIVIVIGVLLLGSLQAIPKQTDKPNPNQQDASQSVQRPVTMQPALAPAGPSSQPEKSGSNSEADDTDWCIKILRPIGENYPLIAVAIWGILVAKKALKATEKSAEAALLNAQALINAERPWISVTATTGADDLIEVHGEVHGRTPAKISAGWGNHIVVTNTPTSLALDALPDDPPYDSKGTELTYEMLAVPGQPKFLIYAFPVRSRYPDGSETRRNIEFYDEFLYVFGRLVYTDILTKDEDGKPTEHETRWSFLYFPSKPEGMVTKNGKPAYNRYT